MSAIKPRTARVTIYQGDDIARLADLDEAVTRAEVDVRRAENDAKTVNAAPSLDETDHPAHRLLAARGAHDAAVAERDAFAADAEARGVLVVLHAQPRREWRRLMSEHGARPDVENDVPFGVNMETMPDALLPISIDREQSTIDGDLGEFLESLSDYDYYDRLFLAAYALNRGSAVADPTLRLGYAPSQTSSATSN